MRIKTLMGIIINVDSIKRSITVEGIELGSEQSQLLLHLGFFVSRL